MKIKKLNNNFIKKISTATTAFAILLSTAPITVFSQEHIANFEENIDALSGFSQSFRMDIPSLLPGRGVAGPSLRLHAWDSIFINPVPISGVRVGITNNGDVSGAIWGSFGQNYIIPSAGNWSVIVQNNGNVNSNAFTLSFNAASVHAFISPPATSRGELTPMSLLRANLAEEALEYLENNSYNGIYRIRMFQID